MDTAPPPLAPDAETQEDNPPEQEGNGSNRANSAHRAKKADSSDQAGPKEKHDKPVSAAAASNAVLWQLPRNIAGLDLFYGQPGAQGQPQPPFTFVREDLHGSSPKCDARDASGKTWRVKLGEESRPEVVASRLLWAVGYFVNDDYVIPRAEIQDLKMRRKSEKLRGTEVNDARFARKPHGEKKIGIWTWKQNPFFGTREFNGLRVMMAVINDWDLKDDNNAVYKDEKSNASIFLVSDVGATFGANDWHWTAGQSKGNLAAFQHSKFVVRNTGTEVDFATPAAPKSLLVESAGVGLLKREHLDWIGKNIPNPDAHWIGTLLGQLSHKQLVDAFRAGNFSPDEIEVYVSIVESRIAELKGL